MSSIAARLRCGILTFTAALLALAARAEAVIDPPHRPAVEFAERLYRAGSTR